MIWLNLDYFLPFLLVGNLLYFWYLSSFLENFKLFYFETIIFSKFLFPLCLELQTDLLYTSLL